MSMEQVSDEVSDIKAIWKEANHAMKELDLHRASDLFVIVAELDPQRPLVFTFLGICLLGLELYESAGSALKEAIQNDENDHVALYTLGDVRLRVHNFEAAIPPLRRAIELLESGGEDYKPWRKVVNNPQLLRDCRKALKAAEEKKPLKALPPLRYKRGDEAYVRFEDEWYVGKIVKLWHRVEELEWPDERMPAPYLLQVGSDGHSVLLYAPEDTDEWIQSVDSVHSSESVRPGIQQF